MNRWTYKVTSVSLKLFGLFPFIRVVGTHLRGCGRSCYFHDFITHETPIKLYSKSHFHRHGTSWAEPEVKVTSRGYCSTSLFCLHCCFVFITMWLSWLSLNLLCLTELLERHKVERGASSHPLARAVYSEPFVGRPFPYFTPFPKYSFHTPMLRTQEGLMFYTELPHVWWIQWAIAQLEFPHNLCSAKIPSCQLLLSAMKPAMSPSLSAFPLISPSTHLISIAGSLGRALISSSLRVSPYIACKMSANHENVPKQNPLAGNRMGREHCGGWCIFENSLSWKLFARDSA